MKHNKPQLSISESELDAMFEFWFQNDRNVTKTAKKYGRDRASIYRWAKRFGWEARAEKIRNKVRRDTDKRLQRKEISNVKTAQKCLRKEVAAYLHDNHEATGDLKAIVQLLKYIDDNGGLELLDQISIAAIPMTTELAKEAMAVLKELADDDE